MQSGWAQYVYSAIMDKVGDRSNSTINQWQVVRSTGSYRKRDGKTSSRKKYLEAYSTWLH